MGDISKDFSRHEHACYCGCGFDTVDAELNRVLQKDIRDHYGKRVTITGPNRCHKQNSQTPGASDHSAHQVGKAADFKVEGVTPVHVYAHLDAKYQNKYGLGLYHNRVHVDVRPKRARWKV